ncbi:MAG: TIM barrel protein [Chloroflexi bacterium]|nr:TIM barrel protein [Chloroflexota bacterium]
MDRTTRSLLFGTGGIPKRTPPLRSTVDGIGRIAEVGLECMEVEFVQGVKMSPATASQVREAAQKAGVRLTAHGPYAINLNSADPVKVQESKERILQTARRGKECGAESIVFHAGFYGDAGPKEAHRMIKVALAEIMEELRKEKLSLSVRTELTGKVTDYGSLEEVLRIASEIPGVAPCLDFAHLHARTGRFNTYAELTSVLDIVETELGRVALDSLHAHVSGIEYAKHGEKKHLPLQESDFHYVELLRAFKDRSVKGFIICESPDEVKEDDALLLQRSFQSL